MSSEIVVTIAVNPSGAASVGKVAEAAPAVGGSAASAGPAPMPIGDLQVAGSADAPGPVESMQLSQAKAMTELSVTPPPPLDLDKLIGAGSRSGNAPTPADFGSLVGQGGAAAGAPMPRMDVSLSATGAGAAPSPMSPEELGKGSSVTDPDKSKPRRG